MNSQPQNHILYIPVEGMESTHCAAIIDQILKNIDGLKFYQTEFNNKRVVIEVTDKESTSKIVEAIQKLGYQVPVSNIVLPVLQMSCAACAVSVESMLQSLNGVLKAEVNYANATVSIEYLPNTVTTGDMQSAVRSIGYDLLTDRSNESDNVLENLKSNALRQLKTRTIGSLVFSIPLMIIGMFFMDMPYAYFLMCLLSSPVVLYFGRHFYIRAFKQIRHGKANMDTLVALSTGVAYIFSWFNMLFPEFWHQRGLHAHVYFEASAVVISFVLLGKWLEENAKGNTATAIKNLMNLQPDICRIKDDENNWIETPVKFVKKGQEILVKPGEKLAVDGIITEGSSYVDESMLSGEPLAVHKAIGSKVFSGTINQKGSFTFIADKVGSETMLQRIIRMVEQAQGSKAPIQKKVDKISSVFVPTVISIALISFLLWVFLAPTNGFTYGLLAFVTVLVIACPCALGLATPTALMVGIGKAAEHGILIKDADNLELAGQVTDVVLDKTGTLTEGRPVVCEELWMNQHSDTKSFLAALENRSEHPLAEAIVQHLNIQPLPELIQFESITGQGVSAKADGIELKAGSIAWLKSINLRFPDEWNSVIHSWQSSGYTVIGFAIDYNLTAVLALADTLKPNSAIAVEMMKNAGITVHMLTGDQPDTAGIIAKSSGIENIQAGVLPEQKSEYILNLQKQGKIVAMVGDGINDSAALAQADVSIAMGKGSDIAMDVAGMTLIGSDLNKIPAAIDWSKQVTATIRHNLFWAFIYNIIGIPLAAGVLFPVNGFLLNPMIAGAAMALSSVSVVSNSLRLKWKKLL